MRSDGDVPRVVFTSGDAKYVRPMTVTIRSVVKNSPGTDFHFVVCSNELDEEAVGALRSASDPHGMTIKSVPTEWLEGLPVDIFPAEMFARLFVDKLVPEGTERVLYLDGDVLAIESIDPLFELDLKDCSIAAAPTGEHPVTADQGWPTEAQEQLSGLLRALGAPASALHFNSGVMVIDVERWRAKGIPELTKRLSEEWTYGDQAYLNAILWDDWLPIDRIWNGKLPNGRVIHFAGRAKPWQVSYYDNEFASRYRAIAREVGWDLTRPFPVAIRHWIRRIALAITPPALKKLIPRSRQPVAPRWRGLG